MYGWSEATLQRPQAVVGGWLVSIKRTPACLGHRSLLGFNMTQRLGKQTLAFSESFVQLSKQRLSRDCQNNVGCGKKNIISSVASPLC